MSTRRQAGDVAFLLPPFGCAGSGVPVAVKLLPDEADAAVRMCEDEECGDEECRKWAAVAVATGARWRNLTECMLTDAARQPTGKSVKRLRLGKFEFILGGGEPVRVE